MGKGINSILAIAGGLLCIVITLTMPWAELGMDASFQNWPEWLKWLSINLNMPLPDYSNMANYATEWTAHLKKAGAESRFGDYAYALVMGLAMIASAVGIAAIGREDGEEKTVLPVKK